MYPRINFLVCLHSSSQPSLYQNPCPPAQGYPIFVRSSHCCMRRSPRPCRVCTSLLLTAGTPILLLSSEIGLAANNFLFIPSDIRPLMHLESMPSRVSHRTNCEYCETMVSQVRPGSAASFLTHNTSISISISAQRAELIATPDFYIYCKSYISYYMFVGGEL